MPRDARNHIGDMTERITPIVIVLVDQGGGAVTETESAGTTVFCNVRQMKGREYLQARQVFGGQPLEISGWYNDFSAYTSDTKFTWHRRGGDVEISSTSPLNIAQDGLTASFMAVLKE